MKRINLTIFASILYTILLSAFVSASVFLDDNNTNWDAGTLHNMKVYGSGGNANISSSGNNVSGHFASQIFDSGSDSSNWTNITIRTEIPYGTEIGQAFSDSSSVSSQDINDFGFINTSGLILLMHFNNESSFGENDSLSYDFSKDVNAIKDETNNGTLYGGAAINKTNYQLGGGAVEFDGTNDYVGTGKSLLNSVDQFTLESWVHADSAGSRVGWVGQNNRIEFGFLDSNTIMCWTASGGDVKWDFTSDTFPFNQWNHVALVGRGTVSPYLELYINGESQKTGGKSVSGYGSNSFDFNIGGGGIWDASGNWFNGQMDEVAIWNRSLSATEIKNHYKRGALRLNLSVRSCDDSACAGDAYQQVSNLSFMGGKITNLSSGNEGLSTNRYFQYNLTYSRNATGVDGNHTIINNVTIEYDFLITKVFPSLKVFNSVKMTIRKGSMWRLRWGS